MRKWLAGKWCRTLRPALLWSLDFTVPRQPPVDDVAAVIMNCS